MNLTETIKVTPEMVPSTLRVVDSPLASSGDAGIVHPVAATALFREDGVQRGQVTVNVEMQETAETLMNGVRVKVMAHLVPWCAFDRFEGSMELFNAAYKGQPGAGGQSVSFFDTAAVAASFTDWHKQFGVHLPPVGNFNTMYLEAFNTLWNFRAKARFKDAPQRALLDTTAAQGFWPNPGRMSNVVPTFDQAVMDGEVELNLFGQAPVSGLGVINGAFNVGTSAAVRETGSGALTTFSRFVDGGTDGSQMKMEVSQIEGVWRPQVFAEMAQAGIKLSLQNIELAKQTAAWAQVRKQYKNISEEHLIDMLMDGIRIPDLALMQPILLAQNTTVLGYDKRYATDGANLEKSVSQGLGNVSLTYRTPRINTGGVILITMEISPEQMFERMEDPFLALSSAEQVPAFVRDFLDPQKVDTIANKQVDVTHTDPDGVFGFEPLNNKWRTISAPRIGGKFFLTDANKGHENRMRIWAPETTDPELTADFYLISDLPKAVFADTLADSFEWDGRHMAQIVGHTVFGKRLEEDGNEYETIDAMVDKTRIESPQNPD